MKTLLLLCLLSMLLSPAGASESGIIGGKKAKPHSRPYMASLQQDGSHFCGGFLIREDFVLTAAHCFRNAPITVVLGAHNLKKKEKSQQKIPVKTCIRHDLNKISKYDFDIMLLKLQRNATLNKYVKVKELPKKGETVSDNTKCLMSGWGKKRPDGPAADILQDVVLTLISSKACKRVWKRDFDGNRMMCTSSDDKKGICQGDSGGPLICNHTPHGIAAFTTNPCDMPEVPNVYTKISYLLPWIKEKMAE